MQTDYLAHCSWLGLTCCLEDGNLTEVIASGAMMSVASADSFRYSIWNEASTVRACRSRSLVLQIARSGSQALSGLLLSTVIVVSSSFSWKGTTASDCRLSSQGSLGRHALCLSSS